MFSNAVILAGGMGSRMMPLTEYVPKPLVKINGVPLISYVISFLRSSNIDNIAVTYGYKSELLLAEISKKVELLINTDGKDNAYFLFNSPIKYINSPIIICPCDMIVQLDMQEVYREYNLLGSPAACLVPVKTNLDADSIFSENSIITKIVRGESSNLHASGIQILNPYLVNKECEGFSNFYDVWNCLIRKKMLYMTSISPREWKVYDSLNDLP